MCTRGTTPFHDRNSRAQRRRGTCNELRETREKFHLALKAVGNKFVLSDSTGNAQRARKTREVESLEEGLLGFTFENLIVE